VPLVMLLPRRASLCAPRRTGAGRLCTCRIH